MGRLFLLVDELQELAYKGHGPQVIEKRFREACSDDVCDEELKVMGRLVMADGFRKHASALGMTKEAFKKHLASIADKKSNAKAWTTKTDGFLYWLLRGCGLDWLWMPSGPQFY